MANLQAGINLMLALLILLLLPYVTFNLLRFLKRVLWDPIRITKSMEAQGIRGPPYKFFNGSTSEANKLMEKSMNSSMDLSHNILPRVQPHLHSWIKLYGRNVLTWYGPTPQLVVGDIELVKEILRDRDGEFPKHEPPEFMKKMLGSGLVTSNGQKWVKQRKLASHAFPSEYLKEMIPSIIDAVEAMLQKWDEFEGKEIDFFKEFCILTSEIISRTAFGSSYVEGKEIFIKVDELIEIAARNFQVVRLPFFRKLAPNQDDIESDKIEKFIRESIQNLVLRREKRKSNGDDDDDDDGYGDDLLGSLMRAYHDNESLSLYDIIDECKTFYSVGQETTSMMLSWTSFLLALNPDWQEKIRLEVLQLFGDRNLSSEDFSAIAKLRKRAIWDPIRIIKSMEAQGIRGPPYKFFNGSTSEANKLMEKSMNSPMELSHNILPKVQPHFHSWIKLYGRNVLTWHGSTPRLVVGETELVKEILSDREEGFPKYEPPEFMKKLLGDGLVTSSGQKWFRQRKLATHAFRSENLKEMIPAIISSVESMLQKWVEFEGKEIDLFKEFCTLTREIISRTAFGSSYIEGKRIFIKIDELTAICARNFLAIRLPFFRKLVPNQDDIEADKIERDIRESILKLIKRREERKENGDDFLGLLMKAHHDDESISLDDIIDECKTFYFTGQETTSIMLSWTSLLLAINTDWQDKVRSEVLQLFGDRSQTSEDFASIAKLRKMTMVINESMRLYPPVLNILRTVAKDCRVGNVFLPKGMQIQISPLVIHHDQSIWGEDAQLFSPDRFAASANGGAAFFPFGAGPRICVGQGLAMLEAKLVLSTILQRYSFGLSPAYVHSPVSRLTCRPQYGIQAVLRYNINSSLSK